MRRGEPWGIRGRVAGVAALLATAVLAAVLAGPWHPPLSQHRGWQWSPFSPTIGDLPLRPPAPDPAEGLRPVLGPSGHQWHAGPWILGTLLVLVTVLAAVALVRPLRRAVTDLLRTRRRGPQAPDGALATRTDVTEPDLAALARGVTEAGTLMHRDVAPADAVIAAWVALEEAARDCGVYREPSQTATDLTVAVLDRTWADPTATRTLLDLYLRARYGGDPTGPDDVTAARSALALLERDLGEQHARWLAGLDTTRRDRS